MEELKELFYINNQHIDNLYELEEEFNYKLKSLIDEYETDDINMLYNCYKCELEIKYINNCYRRLIEDIDYNNLDDYIIEKRIRIKAFLRDVDSYR